MAELIDENENMAAIRRLTDGILKADAEREAEYAELVAIIDGQRDIIQTLEAEIESLKNKPEQNEIKAWLD